MSKKIRLYIAGHQGMVGSNLVQLFKNDNNYSLISATKEEVNLVDQVQTNNFIKYTDPDVIILAAGKVGGIGANIRYPAEFIYENTMISSNVIEASRINNVSKLIFFGTSSVYPTTAKQPFREKELLNGVLEKTNEAYSIAKINGIKQCEYYFKQYGNNFYSIMPANLYGPYDHFGKESGHVIPSLISKIFNAKINKNNQVELWGTGNPLREFLFAPDLAKAIKFLIENINAEDIYKNNISVLNIGSSKEYSIKHIANVISAVIGFKGGIVFNDKFPDGVKRKAIDSNLIKSFGWNDITDFEESILLTYNWFAKNI